MKHVILLTLYLIFFSVLVHGQEICTREEAMNAEADASNLRTWSDYYKSYQKYAHCDDGSIAEGYSWSTMKLLKNHWHKIHEFNELSREKAFKDFVYFHINETYSKEELISIKNNCQKNCPGNQNDICIEIENIVTDILKNY